MPSRLVACGSEDNAQDKLGSAMRFSGGMAELAEERDEPDLVVEDMIRECVQAGDDWDSTAGNLEQVRAGGKYTQI